MFLSLQMLHLRPIIFMSKHYLMKKLIKASTLFASTILAMSSSMAQITTIELNNNTDYDLKGFFSKKPQYTGILTPELPTEVLAGESRIILSESTNGISDAGTMRYGDCRFGWTAFNQGQYYKFSITGKAEHPTKEYGCEAHALLKDYVTGDYSVKFDITPKK